jgi:hypothetical protein
LTRKIEFVERKSDWHGRFGAYLYRVLDIAAQGPGGRLPRRPSAKGGEVKLMPPPDMGLRWPLIRGKLNVMKYPPYPPKRTLSTAIGGSLVKMLLQGPIN